MIEELVYVICNFSIFIIKVLKGRYISMATSFFLNRFFYIPNLPN